jgi:hypothetical protein
MPKPTKHEIGIETLLGKSLAVVVEKLLAEST